MNNDILPPNSQPNQPQPVHQPPANFPPTPQVNPVANTPPPLAAPATVATAVQAGSTGGRDSWYEFGSLLGIFAIALAVAALMIVFVFRSYQVDGPSMQQTLQNQDKLIIWKVPRTWARLTHHAYIPKRGDIIVFTESGLGQFGQADSKQLIKRVIGLPNDHVVVKDGTITIYNKDHPNGFQPDKTLGYAYPDFPITTGTADVTLKADQLFACGDNRPDSLDSRSFGPINANQVVGKLVVRVFPTNKIKAF